MSSNLSIYNGAKLEIGIGKSQHFSHGWIEFAITETNGQTHEVTIHFDTAEGYAAAKRLAHIQMAINADQDEAA